jgi:transketolase
MERICIMDIARKRELEKIACKVRMGIIDGVHSAKAGHPGGSLSCTDILTYLYFEKMNIDPQNPKKADRDRFVLSKGHAAPALYSVLAHRGFFETEKLTTLRKIGSILQGHGRCLLKGRVRHRFRSEWSSSYTDTAREARRD